MKEKGECTQECTLIPGTSTGKFLDYGDWWQAWWSISNSYNRVMSQIGDETRKKERRKETQYSINYCFIMML